MPRIDVLLVGLSPGDSARRTTEFVCMFLQGAYARIRFAGEPATGRHLLQDAAAPGSIAGGVTVGDRHFLDLNATRELMLHYSKRACSPVC